MLAADDRARLGAVTFADPIEINCRISSLAEPISGELVDPMGRRRQFRGWMELANGLVALAESTREPGPFPGARPTQPSQGEHT